MCVCSFIRFFKIVKVLITYTKRKFLHVIVLNSYHAEIVALFLTIILYMHFIFPTMFTLLKIFESNNYYKNYEDEHVKRYIYLIYCTFCKKEKKLLLKKNIFNIIYVTLLYQMYIFQQFTFCKMFQI